MALRENLLPIFEKVARAKVDGFGLRTNSLTIETRTWPSGIRAPGTYATVVSLAITPRPRVRDLTMREVEQSGGRYRMGDVRADKITPKFTGQGGGGYTPAQLRGTGGANVEIVYVLAGPTGTVEYTLIDSDFSRNFGYSLTLRRRNTTP